LKKTSGGENKPPRLLRQKEKFEKRPEGRGREFKPKGSGGTWKGTNSFN